MVAIERGYYDAPFKGLWGVTQGNPLHPKIFGIVVGAVVRHWLEVAVEETSGMEGL